MKNRQWFTVTQASEYSGLSERTLRREILVGRLQASRISPRGKYLITRRNLDAFLMHGKCRLNDLEKHQLAEGIGLEAL